MLTTFSFIMSRLLIPGSDVCLGDFGAPLLIADAPEGNISEGSPGRDRLVGIPSIGTDERNATSLPGLYTSVEFFLPWITNLTDAELKVSIRPEPSLPLALLLGGSTPRRHLLVVDL